jgi:outer membrane protein assembly factor BamB
MHVPADDWACFKGTPERTNSSDTPAPDSPYLLWKIDTGSALYASPVVKNGRVFQVGMEEILCIDLDTGKVLWTSPVPAYHSTPAVSDDKAIVATNRGISALSAEDGRLLWEYIVSERFSKRFSLNDYIVSSPVIVNGNVVVGTRPYGVPIAEGTHTWRQDQFFLVCLDENTGKEEWYVGTNLGVLTSPCVTLGKVFAASREMLAIDFEKGNILWKSEDKYPFDPFNPEKTQRERYAFCYSTPALYHGLLVAGSSLVGWQKIVVMDQYTGDILWEWVEEGALTSSPALSEGRIYFYSYDGRVQCLSLLDGEELWKTPISQPEQFEIIGMRLWPSPAVADGKVYIGSIEGVFYCLNAATGEVLWEYTVSDPIHSSPAITSEGVLISSTGGLYCFGIDPETYRMKAEKYLENSVYDRAEEFLEKAKDYAKTNEDTEEIDKLLDLVNSNKEEYQKTLDRLSEAEAIMDEADTILWNNQFEKAQHLYSKASTIYEELNDEFRSSFCKNRVDYIQGRIIKQEERKIHQLQILFFLICILIAVFIIVRLKRFLDQRT